MFYCRGYNCKCPREPGRTSLEKSGSETVKCLILDTLGRHVLQVSKQQLQLVGMAE